MTRIATKKHDRNHSRYIDSSANVGRYFGPAILAAALATALPGASAAPPDGPPNAGRSGIVGFVPGRILVQPRAGLDDREFDDIVGKHDGKRGKHMKEINVHMVEVAPGNEEAAVRAMKKNRHVKFAELDLIVEPAAVPSDPGYASQWHLRKIGTDRAWDFAWGDNVILAILDTGVDATHPDLAAQMVPGWNTYNNTADSSDVQGHGTAVAGTAAASGNNALGVSGVNWRARIMPIRISDPNGYATISAMASGIYWAADRGARVANISFSGLAGSPTIHAAADYMRAKGGVVVASAENTGTELTYPMSPSLTVVSATDSADAKASWSSFGNFVDIAAPGNMIYSTTRGGGYGNWYGTSFSSPVVAGVYGLMISANPNLSAAALDSILFETALDLGDPGKDKLFGVGRANAGAAVERARNTVAGDTQPPAVAIAAPLSGSRVAGLVAVDVSATDSAGVTRVDLFANGTLVASDASSPFGFSWNTTRIADGAATLNAKAYDAAGNLGTSANVGVTVANDVQPPAVTVAAPSPVTVAQSVTVSASATDNGSVSKVEFYQNGVLKSSDTTAPYTYAWPVTSANNGSWTWIAKAYDAAGNVGTSAPLAVTVNVPADTVPPTARIDNPIANSVVSRSATITVNSTDNVGVKEMELYIDGALRATGTSSSLTYSWNTRKAAPGQHTIRAVARDGAGNRGEASISVLK